MAWQFLSAEQYAAWITPAAALARVTNAVPNQHLAMNVIFQRITDELLQTCAATAIFKKEWPQEQERYTNWLVTPYFWSRVAGGAQGTFWTTSSAQFPYERDKSMSCHGLRFDPDGITALLADISTEMAGKPSEDMRVPIIPAGAQLAWRETTRRPQKDFWDEMLIAVIAKIWDGWQPKTQEEVAKAMLAWATEHGHDVGDTAVKKPAKKVFQAFKI